MASISDTEEFVNIWVDHVGQEAPMPGPHKDPKDFYAHWVEQSSAKMAIPSVTGAEALRRLYPKHSLVLTQGYGMSILGFPGATVTPIEKSHLVTNLVFIPLARSLGTVPGVLVDSVQYGAFKVTWKQFEFLVYAVSHPLGFGTTSQYFILHEGPEEVSRLFLLASGAWTNDLHEEIWVFNQGFWQKDHGLWVEVQKADWKDVILKDEFKKALQKDVYGFFSSESVYKELGIPWKRGLIMHGPPGNGKTISLKTIMKTCGEKGFAPLYVKSFQSYMGEEGSMAVVFSKARQLAPCVIILEDLDSLINDGNRSFFLNQLDGLEGNDGLLIIGTTNHFDRLDPGLSTRPSRFDRKYYFGDPDESERTLYAQYWQKKLASNKEIEFPDKLVAKVAKATDKFSFAYLKEAFVSSLVTFAGVEGQKPSFESILMSEIDALRKQLDKSFATSRYAAPSQGQHDTSAGDARTHHHSRRPHPEPTPSDDFGRIRALLDSLSEKAPRVPGRIYQGGREQPYSIGSDAQNNRDIRALLDELSDSLASLDIPSMRAYDAPSSSRGADAELDSGDHLRRDFRSLMDRIVQKDWEAEHRYYYTEPANPGRHANREWRKPGSVSIVPDSPSPQRSPTFSSSGSQNSIVPRFGTDLA